MIRIINFIIILLTWGMVEISEVDYTKDNHHQIEELNGLSLHEVFNQDLIINNTFDLNYNGWLTYITGGSVNWVSGRVQIISTTGVSSIYQSNKIINGNYYYVRIDIESIIGNTGFEGFTSPPVLSTGSHSFIRQGNTTSFTVKRANNGDNIYVDNIYLYDLTDLGIDDLTVEEMDDYYDQYIDNLQYQPNERYEYTINTLDMTDLILIISSLSVWALGIIFIKEFI
jgi:hypothetical protein